MQKPIAVPVRKLSVYLHPFHRSSFLECALQLKVAKINRNPLIRLKSSLLVLVVIGSMPMPICNRFRKTGQQR